MGGKFPSEFPQQGVQALLGPVFRSSPIDGQVALGGYDLVGFALYQLFGDVSYNNSIMEQPGDVANALAQAPPEVQQFMDFTNRQGNQIMDAQSMPPWMAPFLAQLAQWALSKLLDRLKTAENPKLFGMALRTESRSLPPQTGGAFPERKLGQPTGTGLHTQSNPPQTTSQAVGAQSQPSDKIQQPTGAVPDRHPSNPQSSLSPQFQGNTADPRLDHEPRPPVNAETRGPGLTNAPGVQGNPVVPRESGGQSGQPAQGPQTNLAPANPPATQGNQPTGGQGK